MVTAKQVQTAYRKLKRLVYYDKTDLRLRQRLAEFECGQTFKSRLSDVEKVLNTRDPVKQSIFQTWLNQIDFRIVPKSLTPDPPDEGKGKFLSNVTSAKVLEVDKVNYFFDGPIELHLIAVLWIMVEGWLLDSQLGAECYGSRLEEAVRESSDQSANLFVRYHELYAGWRDSGIRKAKQLLAEEQKNVCILGLDVQQYFYRIRLDFGAVAQSIYQAALKESGADDAVVTPSSLLRCLQAIHETYRRKIGPSLEQTHEDVPRRMP